MSTRSDRYVARHASGWGPVSIPSIEGGVLSSELRAALVGFACIEAYAIAESRKVEAIGLDREFDVQEFLPSWLGEELQHARFIMSLVEGDQCVSMDEVPPTASEWRAEERKYRMLVRPFAQLTDVVRLVYLVTGATAELTAAIAYREIARQLPAGGAREGLMAIAKQETSHMRFYVGAARTTIQRMSRVERSLANATIRRTWQPVGIDRLGMDDWKMRFGFLLSDPAFVMKLRGVDRLFSTFFSGKERIALASEFLEDNAA
jgi:hypothetical protein